VAAGQRERPDRDDLAVTFVQLADAVLLPGPVSTAM
jgi:hypothetical protein